MTIFGKFKILHHEGGPLIKSPCGPSNDRFITDVMSKLLKLPKAESLQLQGNAAVNSEELLSRLLLSLLLAHRENYSLSFWFTYFCEYLLYTQESCFFFSFDKH